MRSLRAEADGGAGVDGQDREAGGCGGGVYLCDEGCESDGECGGE